MPGLDNSREPGYNRSASSPVRGSWRHQLFGGRMPYARRRKSPERDLHCNIPVHRMLETEFGNEVPTRSASRGQTSYATGYYQRALSAGRRSSSRRRLAQTRVDDRYAQRPRFTASRNWKRIDTRHRIPNRPSAVPGRRRSRFPSVGRVRSGGLPVSQFTPLP